MYSSNFICEGLTDCPDNFRSNNNFYSLRDDKTSCWLDTYGRGAGECPCPGGWTNMGLYCYKWWPPNSQKCNCRGDQERNGALCYPKCKPGYSNFGCCLCQPEGGPRIALTAFQRDSCFNRKYSSWNRLFSHIDQKYNEYMTQPRPQKLFMIQTFFQAPSDASGTVKQIFSQLESQPYAIARRANANYYVADYLKNKRYAPNISMVDDAGADSVFLKNVVEQNAREIYKVDNLLNLPLNRYPFVGSHDSATGYSGNNLRVNAELKIPTVAAQSLNFLDQYKYGGIRFFDCRIDFFRGDTSKKIGLDPNHLLFQHTVPLEYVKDDQNFRNLINQSIQDREIILLYFSHSDYKEEAKNYIKKFMKDFMKTYDYSFCIEELNHLQQSSSYYKSKNQYILYYCDDQNSLLADNWDSSITCI